MLNFELIQNLNPKFIIQNLKSKKCQIKINQVDLIK